HVAFVFADTPHTRVYALSLHDALPISVEPWRGTNLVALDLSGIAHAVGVQPWVERVTLSKRLPDGLAIRVTERKAVALFREGSRLWWLSREGRTIALYDPRADSAEYVLVSGDRRALPEATG